MSKKKLTYKELQEKLTQAEEAIEALRSGRVDVILGENCPLVIKAKHFEEESKKLNAAIEQTSDWVLITDRDGTIEYVNKAVERISEYGREELIGKNPRIFKSGKHNREFYKNLWDTICSGNTFNAILINRKKTGDLFELHYTITPLKDEEGQIHHFIATAKDLTEQKILKEQIEYISKYDILTGLYNRKYFAHEIDELAEEAQKQTVKFAVVVVDIDRFTALNDTFGFEAGDEILKRAGRRIVNSICAECKVARFEADKYGILLSDIENPEDIILVLEKIRSNFNNSFKIDNEDVFLSLSMGISIFPENGNSAENLIKNAEVALSKAKSVRLNNYQFFEEEINIKTSEFVHMQRHLFHALEKNEFIMHYQPYFDCQTRELKGLEALIRWNSPKFGLVLPGMFIPFLEETGMILEVGKWIIRTVCKQIKTWINKGYEKNIVPVYINLSSTQFAQKNLMDFINETIEQTGIKPEYLGFEITESTFIEDIENTKAVLESFKQKGISVNIDDFGTGYSSLSSLWKLPFNNLKIDCSFIKELTSNPDNTFIVITIISLAHNLNIKTIAEGVENELQWQTLRILKCDMVQGYYFSKPLSADEIERFLKS
ncbi:MAG: EAL domain-containing protein [Nitrospirae bacterium]|nr:EAL domain-containing protein [Nitrospirota bacterium]